MNWPRKCMQINHLAQKMHESQSFGLGNASKSMNWPRKFIKITDLTTGITKLLRATALAGYLTYSEEREYRKLMEQIGLVSDPV